MKEVIDLSVDAGPSTAEGSEPATETEPKLPEKTSNSSAKNTAIEKVAGPAKTINRPKIGHQDSKSTATTSERLDKLHNQCNGIGIGLNGMVNRYKDSTMELQDVLRAEKEEIKKSRHELDNDWNIFKEVKQKFDEEKLEFEMKKGEKECCARKKCNDCVFTSQLSSMALRSDLSSNLKSC